jgi:hypothetical protein
VAHALTENVAAENGTAPPTSLFLIPTVTTLGVPSVAPPVGADSSAVNDRSPSSRTLGRMLTRKFAANTPAPNVSTPEVAW